MISKVSGSRELTYLNLGGNGRRRNVADIALVGINCIHLVLIDIKTGYLTADLAKIDYQGQPHIPEAHNAYCFGYFVIGSS
jgi:hypothetical protein